jgi:DNA-binding transcriptional LysR family regulator
MIGITPRQIEVFVAVARSGSVRAAAERVHMTQPAASMALAELERQLGAPLFDRERGRLRLNARGREMVPMAQEMLQRLEDFQRAGSAAPQRLSGELRVGASNTVGNYRVGELLGGFVAAHPDVALQLRVDNTAAVASAMLDHALDVACVEGPVSHPALQVHPWREDRLVVCARPDHPLAKRRRLRPEHFADAPWILRESGSATRSLTERALEALPPGRTVLELGQVEAIKQAVMAGMGIGCLPAVAVEHAVAAGRLTILRTPFLALERRLSLLLHRSAYRGALVEAFLTCVEADETPA